MKGGSVSVAYIGRYENFLHDAQYIFHHLGLEVPKFNILINRKE